ncbi:MAG TPA: hypothetical protein VH595_13535 [Verrucomicrobiae bacterium]|jgi:hypothetical protein|nr:hypothetical protein [Verrucomicrobiae bacterium]
MNTNEAKQILMLFRPGTADETDSSFDEARQLAANDPELAQWFKAHSEAYLILRRKFQSIPVPVGLKEQILSERKIHRSAFQIYWRPALAIAAVVALLLGIYASVWHVPGADRYAAYRKRMTETALRSYYMELISRDPIAIRAFLKSKNAPADYSLPSGLKTAAVVGCVASKWHGNPVSMICFKSGRPLPPGDQSDLWLFVTDRSTIANPPSEEQRAPVFARVNKATTASWSGDGKIYLLAAVGDEALLRKYIQ